MPWTSGAIDLSHTGNTQGTHYLLDKTKTLAHNNWTVLHMPAEAIMAIHKLVGLCKMHKGIVFTDKDDNMINNKNDDETTIQRFWEWTILGSTAGAYAVLTPLPTHGNNTEEHNYNMSTNVEDISPEDITKKVTTEGTDNSTETWNN